MYWFVRYCRCLLVGNCSFMIIMLFVLCLSVVIWYGSFLICMLLMLVILCMLILRLYCVFE